MSTQTLLRMMCLLVCLFFTIEGAAQAVDIPDSNLRAEIETALGKASGATITIADMVTLTHFNFGFDLNADTSNVTVSNLTGLEHAINLTGRGLVINNISHLSRSGNLDSLEWLFLWGNNIRDLSGLWNIDSLEWLFLGDNNISNLSTLGSLDNLTGLHLGTNNIRDLSGLWNIDSLEWLFLGDNNISNLSTLGSLDNLTGLHLGTNNIRDLSGLWNIDSLEWLFLGDNNISNLSTLGSLDNLTGLHLGTNNIRDLSGLWNIDSLEWLFLGDNNISNLSTLGSLDNLTGLHLGTNNIRDLSGLWNIDSLEWLFLGDNNISNLSTLGSLDNLTGLHLGTNNIRDLSGLWNIDSLEWLFLGDNNISNLSTLGSLDNLTGLHLGTNNITITDASFLRQRGVEVLFDKEVALPVDTTPTVNIPDPNLRRAVEAVLGKAAGAPITANEMTTLTRLTPQNANIRDLTGLEHATNLRSLFLENNSASNLSPLAGLTNLRTLYLDGNSISNITPLSGLINLEQLDLEVNSISNVSALSGLTNLGWLNLNNNSVSDISPLVSNTGLRSGDTVYVQRNPLSSQSLQTHIPTLQGRGVTVLFDAPRTVNIPDPNLRTAIESRLGKTADAPITANEMTPLTRLTARDANIRDLTGLEHAANLRSLDLIGNSISNLSPLSSLINLTSLVLDQNSISDVSALSGLTNLNRLRLGSNTISNVSPLSRLTNLSRLRLYENSISDVSALSGLTSLTWLNLAGNSISDVSALAGLTNLTGLSIYNNTISDLSPLVANTGLGSGEEVNVEGNPLNTASINTHIPALQQRGVTVFFDPPQTVTSPAVNIPDPNLRDAIESILAKTPGEPIIVADMETLTWLDASNANISNLTGLEYATNLTELYLAENSISDLSPLAGLTNLIGLNLAGNSISDLSPLSGLTNLTELYLAENSISDLSPLVANTGLGSGEEVYVHGNPLSSQSLQTHIPALQGRGVTVHFDVPPDQTSVLVVEGTITNTNGSSAEAGLNVTVTIGSLIETTVSETGGDYRVTFVNLGGVASSSDTVIVQVRRQSTGESGSKTVQLSAEQILASRATIDLQFSSATAEYLLSVPAGISLIHVPLKVAAVEGVAKTITSIADLYDVLGGEANVIYLITRDSQTQQWISYLSPSDRGTPVDRKLTDDMGIIANLITPVPVHVSGSPLGANGNSTITLNPGINLVGLPLKNSKITHVSDLFALEGIKDNVSVIMLIDKGKPKGVQPASDASTIPIIGGQAFIMTAQRAATVTISGGRWNNTAAMGAAPPIGNTDLHSLPDSIQATDTTPVLALSGSIDSPIDGWGRMPYPRSGSGFRVIVKNRSTGRAATGVTGVGGIGYQLTIVDTETGRAAQIGDSLEISARSPDPSIGIQPLRYTVTAEDVKRSQVQLPTLVAYEIPAKTELLPNHPNPFNPDTWIPYQLSEGSAVTVKIYDVTGSLVRTIEMGHKPMGYYLTRERAVYWDGRSKNGESVSSGVYFYTLITDHYTQTRRMVIVK